MKKLIITTLLILTQLSATTYEYDALNRLKTATYANGVVYSYSYDDAGNLLSVETTGIADPTDTDHDGIPDKTESDLGLDPTKADTDGDGYSDLEEVGDVNHPRDTDHDGTIDALDTDSDNDGMSDADEREAGTSPTDPISHPAITLAIHAIPDMYIATNAEINPIDIAIDTNLIGTASIKTSSSDIDIVVADDGNPLELTTVEDATGRATVTVTATIGTHSDQEQFVVTVGETKFYMQNSEDEWEELISEESDNNWIGKHDDQSFDYNRTDNGVTTKIHSSFVGTIGRAYNDGRKSIVLPTVREIRFDIDTDGGVEAHIEGAVSPSGDLPLGTHIDASPGEIEFIIPMTDRVRF